MRANAHDRKEKIAPASAEGLPKPARAKHTVRVTFTPLQTPHLPAREAREVELKASKQEREQLQLQVCTLRAL